MREWVFHVDLDQFLAAVEILRRPELAGLPIVVGGDGNPNRPRQVVATASYAARAFGVRSGMPLRTAVQRCPNAVFLRSDKPAYEAASADVMAALRSLDVEVEEWGWDEAVVGALTDDPESFARLVQQRVLDRTHLTCAVGIGETRLQAKTATAFAKPGGIARLTNDTWLPTMGSEPVTALSGIGARTAARLADVGIRTVADLAAADHRQLAARFGPTIGPSLKLLGLGGLSWPIDSRPHVARSRGREVTFERDVTEREEIERHIGALADAVVESVVAEGRRVTHVAVKVRTATFFTRTRIRKLTDPTIDPMVVAAMARAMLDLFDLGRPIRLLGVRVVLDELEPG